MPDIELARREGIELVRTGTWGALTGSWTPTRADILAAVEAQQCPAIRRPRLKLGHTDVRFNGGGDGEPALGWIENLRAADDGDTLVGDQVALPWLNSVQAAAYPDRSVEGNYRHRCSLGHTHPFVLTAVALLGVTPPAVSTLKSVQDLPAMLGVAASSEVPDGAEHVQVTIRAAEAEPEHTGAMIALIPTAGDAERLTVDGGETAEELHVTLAYLGEAAALGAQGRQDVIDAVSTAANGLPVVEADAFSVSVFNPPGMASDDGRQRDTCLVLGFSGDLLDAVHEMVAEALWSVPMPEQHRPWHAHMTLAYSDDLTRIADLAAKVGPVRFDRLRMAFAGETIDIPLIAPAEAAASAVDHVRVRVETIRNSRGPAPTVEAAAHTFDEHQHKRDGDGQFAHTAGGPGAGKTTENSASATPSRDKLKLAARIHLDDGETLVSSGKVTGGGDSTGDTVMATVDTPDGRTLRIGTVPHSDAGKWDAGAASAATLDEDAIGRLWDDLADLDAEITKQGAEHKAAVKAHQARVEKLFDDANDWFSGLGDDERTAEASAKYKQMRLAAYQVDRDESPPEEYLGETKTVDGANGAGIAYRLTGSFDGDSQRWEVQAAVRPVGAGGDWSLDRETGGDVHTAWAQKQLREMVRTIDRLTADDAVKAAVGEPQPQILPAAEPEQEINPDPKEGLVSTELSGIRSRLGLDDTADEQAILSALDELKTKADTPAVAEPTPEMVAASAAATEKAEKATEAADLMKEELGRLSGELATIKASAAQTVKASFFGGLLTAGKLKPADRETWEQRYDRDPEMVTDILSVRAEGSEVPVMASGVAGSPEPTGGDEDWDSIVARLDGPVTGKAV